jgi:hypothetical protein
VLQVLWENKLYLKPEKYKIEKGKIEFLRVIVRNGQVRMDPKKVAVIRDWSILKTKKDCKPFWGFATSIAILSRTLGRSSS